MESEKKIVVIGGSGFVGSRLLLELDVSKCINFDKRPSPFYNQITKTLDIRFKEHIQLPKTAKVVILLAAEHRDDVSPVSLYYDVNVKGTKNVLDKMDEQGINHLVFTSTVAVYGLNKLNPDETHLLDPFNHYGKTKHEAEKLIRKWYEKDSKNRSVSIIRPTVIFGERNRGNVHNLLKQICSRKFLMIGDGQNMKSMAYVGNVAAFIKDRVEKTEAGYHVFNYADKPDYNMTDLVAFIEKTINIKTPKIKIPYWLGVLGGYTIDVFAKFSRKKLPISSIRVKKFCATTQFDASKAQTCFDPPFTIEQGLKKTIEYEFINPKQDDVLFFSE